ncbi:MAG: methyltransferase domain-containing protein, partial [Calditrichaeota bacterium]|nr:methyltransferase domain-containing protein [Calditrichota bacterium]
AGEAKEWKYQLLKCRSCGLGFVDPSPSWNRLASFYQDYACYEDAEHDPIGGKGSLKYRAAKCRYATYRGMGIRQLVRSSVGLAVEWITGKTVSLTLGIPLQLPKDANILELGYGSGGWLLSMSGLGYKNLHGYDIDTNRENASRLSSVGINISSGDFHANRYPESFFDCIRLEHVLEHLLEPREVLAKCYRLLKPGGILVLNSPCIDSWLARRSIRHYPGLQIPWHLYHHTPRSAGLLLEAVGFEIVRLKPYAVPVHVPVCINGVLSDRGPGWIKIPSFFFLPFAPIHKLVCTLTGKGEFLTALCRKRLSSK